MIKIDKDIPFPTGKTATSKYPFGEMKVGDSFALPKERAIALSSSANSYRRAHPGMKFCVRTVEKEVRVWRTA